MHELAKELHRKISALIHENERLRVSMARLQAELADTRLSLDEEIATNRRLDQRVQELEARPSRSTVAGRVMAPSDSATPEAEP